MLQDESDDRDNFSGGSRHGLGLWIAAHTAGGAVDAQVRRAKVAALYKSSGTLTTCPGDVHGRAQTDSGNLH